MPAKQKDRCEGKLTVARDAIEVIQGKWRIPIIISLTFGGKRFGEIQRDIADISPKMLSQELKVLETNKMVTRTIYDSMPITVEYELTPLGKSSTKLIEELLKWGAHFRKEVLSTTPSPPRP